MQKFVNKHRLSIQIGAKSIKNVYAMCTYFRLSFHFSGWAAATVPVLQQHSNSAAIITPHQHSPVLDGLAEVHDNVGGRVVHEDHVAVVRGLWRVGTTDGWK